MNLHVALKVLWKIAVLLMGMLNEKEQEDFKPLVDLADDLTKRVG